MTTKRTEAAGAELERKNAIDEMASSLGYLVNQTSQSIGEFSAGAEIRDLYKDLGIEPFTEPEAKWEAHEWGSSEDEDVVSTAVGRKYLGSNAEGVRELAREWAACELAREYPGQTVRTFEFAEERAPIQFDHVQRSIGFPGTKIIDGRMRVEQNPRLAAGLARGRLGNPGEYEELYRVDPMTHRFCNETATLICGATYDYHVPQEVDDGGELDSILERAHRRIMTALGTKWRHDSATFTRQGFAMSEPIWAVDDSGFIYIARCEFREQAATWRHIFDDRMDAHIATEFLTSGFGIGRGKPDFTLTRGVTPDTFRLLNVNINAVGNLIDGLPSTRPVTGIDKIRQLVMQLFALSYQRFGLPIAKVFADLSAISSAVITSGEGVPKPGDIQNIANRLQKSRGRKGGGVVPLTPGTDFEFVHANAEMPSPREMLDYLDTLKGICLGNEGVLTGTQSFGSYALATVADSRYMRVAPIYAERFAVAMTEILHAHVAWNYSRIAELEQLPFYSARFPAQTDAARWLTDARETWAAQPWTWPKAMREQAAVLLGLPSTTFDDPEEARAIMSTNGLTDADLEVAA